MPGQPQAKNSSSELVRRIPSDPEKESPEAGIGLCLSGGGFRAMLFHLGSLWRLNEFGYLPRLERISSVSGGSIVAAVLGMNWDLLTFDESGVGLKFTEAVVGPIRRIARTTLDFPAIVKGLFVPGNISKILARSYSRHLYGTKTLQDLPDRPRFVINATNVQSGVIWRFSKPYMWDWRVGKIEIPQTRLASAVAASSAFPPFLSPTVLRFKHADFVPDTGYDLQEAPYTTRVLLTDGGVYGNLGLETVWKRYDTILVSDGGGSMGAQGKPWLNWPLHAYRILNIIDNQVRSLRKRQLIDGYQTGKRQGTYWGIRSNIKKYGLPDALPCQLGDTLNLANVATRLKHVPDTLQEQLINWGYAICDAAMRKHVDLNLPRPSGLPYPGAGVC